MRILVAHNVPRARTGGMSRIMGFIHDRVVAAGSTVDYFCAEDVPAHLSGRLARFTFPFLVRKRAIDAARAGQAYDIINVHEPSSAAVSCRRASMSNPKLVVTTHGVEQRGWALSLEELHLGRGGPGLRTRVVYPLTSLWQSSVGLRRADHIFCLNCEDRDFLRTSLKIADRMITRIYPGASHIYTPIGRTRSYAKVDRLLFAGTWLDRKGIKDMVAAFTRLAELYPELCLQVLGGGCTEERIREDFPVQIRSRVSSVHSSNETETAAIYAGADVYVLPSLFEGTPLTLIEAMMSGMPIVTTSTCGMKDVIDDGENGLLAPVRSPEAITLAVERLIHDEALRSRLGRKACADALEHYTWDKVALPVIDAYVRLLGDD
jgi:glycosyltransferase involved in cell wall biosynthesis